MAEEKEVTESAEEHVARAIRCKWQKHPGSDLAVYGELLKPGDKIEPNDMYSSTNGRWEPAPCPGLVLQEGNDALPAGVLPVIWVRPLHPNPRQEDFSYLFPR